MQMCGGMVQTTEEGLGELQEQGFVWERWAPSTTDFGLLIFADLMKH